MKFLVYIIIYLTFFSAYAQNSLKHFNLKGNITSFTEITYTGTYNSKTDTYIKKDTAQLMVYFFNKKGLLTYATHKFFEKDTNSSMYSTFIYKNDLLVKILNKKKPREFEGENPIDGISNISYPEPNTMLISIVSKEDVFHFENTMIFKNDKLKKFVMKDLKYNREPILSETYEYDKNGDILKTKGISSIDKTITKHLKYDEHKNSIYSVTIQASKPYDVEISERIIQYAN